MKIAIFALSLSAAFATVANAQSAWEGAYAGASFATFSGESTYDNGVDPSDSFDLEGEMFGAFAGYNAAVSGFIVGGEIAAMSGDVFEEGFEGEYEYTSFVDLKARAGYDAGQFMPYAVLGMSIGNFSVNEVANPDRDEDISDTGVVFGAGVDIAINDQFTVGAEILRREFEYDFDINLADMTGEVTSVALRGAYKF